MKAGTPMIKIIIVEDENIIRLGLSTLIQWNDYHFELCGLFKNGQEALSYLLEHPVDIVITDIKMPVMDGEQLIQKIHSHKLNPYIIILSNYSDFSLVKSCFKYGITDYLLKQELDRETLLSLLQNISKNFTDRTESTETHTLTVHDYFQQLVNTDFQEDITRLNIKYRPALYKRQNCDFCICIAELFYRKTSKKYTGTTPVYSVLENIIKEILNQYCKNYLFPYLDHTLLIVLCPEKDSANTFYTDDLTDAFINVQKRLHSFFNMDLRIGTSVPVQNTEGLRNAFLQAKKSQMNLFYEKDTLISFPTSTRDHDIPVFPLGHLQKLIQSCNIIELEKLVYNFLFQLKRTKNIPPKNILGYIKYLFMDLNQLLEEMFSISLSSFDENWENIEQTHYLTLYTLEDYLMNLLSNIKNFIHEQDHSNNAAVKAQFYIKEHFAEDISLQTVADYLHINPSYLSSLFKTKTEQSFTQYVTDIRIHEAMRLLQTTNKTANEIAELVGYNNTNYFIKVFKKTTGKTISDYRR